MKPAIALVRTLHGQYTLVLNQPTFTWGELENTLAYVRKTGFKLEQNWGNGLGPLSIGTANFITG